MELFSEERESGGEGEGEETGNHGEAKRRRDRLEREEFIRKCKENEDLLELDQDSQAILSSITDTTTSRSHLSSESILIIVDPLIKDSLSRKHNVPRTIISHSNKPSRIERPPSGPNMSLFRGPIIIAILMNRDIFLSQLRLLLLCHVTLHPIICLPLVGVDLTAILF